MVIAIKRNILIRALLGQRCLRWFWMCGTKLQILFVTPRLIDVKFVVKLLMAYKRQDLLHPTVLAF